MQPQVWHQHYDPGVPISLDYPPHPVDYFLRQTAQNLPPEKIALIYGSVVPRFGELHETLTFQALDALVDRFAAGLQVLGLQKGDRVALYLVNCPQLVIAYYGTLRAGGIVVPVNPLYVAREIKQQLNDSGAKYAVVLSRFYGEVKAIRAETRLQHVLLAHIKEYWPPNLRLLFTLSSEWPKHWVDLSSEPNTSRLQDMLAAAPPQPQPVVVNSNDTAALMYTGGTTGVPKGAQLTHANLVANAIQAACWLLGSEGRGGQEVMLTALPLTHAYAMTACMNVSIFNGFSQILIPNPRDINHLLNVINIHRPTLFPGVPALYMAINNHPAVKVGQYHLQSIKACISGAASLPVEVKEEFEGLTGSKLVEGYGLSEASPVTHINPLSSSGRPGAIGVPIPDTEAKIVDQQTERITLPPGETGILCVRGPQVMKGYWNMPTETANALRRHADGKVWLHTGDIAAMSADGYFRIVDRQKDMILAAGGLNVYPRDIEERLYEHPKVFEVAAIGVPINAVDQRAKVFVVLKKDQTATAEELIEWCRQGLARYKVPKYIEFCQELPKSFVGKILRRKLVEKETT